MSSDTHFRQPLVIDQLKSQKTNCSKLVSCPIVFHGATDKPAVTSQQNSSLCSAQKTVMLTSTRIQGSLLASDIKMYIVNCLGDVPFTCKQHITNTSLVINNSNLTFEHVTLLTYRQTCTVLNKQAPASCAPNLQSKHTHL